MQPVIPRTGSDAAERLISELRSLIPGLQPSKKLCAPETCEDFHRARSRKKPIEVWNSSVCVKIYSVKWRDKKRRKIYRSHELRWTDAGQRFRRKLSSLELAKRRAFQIAGAISTGETNRLQFSQANIASFMRCLELADSVKKPVELIVAEYVEEDLILDGASHIESAKFFKRHQPAAGTPKTVPEIFAEMIPARKVDGKSKNTIDDWRSRLKRFADSFPVPLLSITSKEINDWLRKLTKKKGGGLVTRRTRNNYRGNVGDLFNFARECGYVPKSWNPLDEVRKVKNEPVRIEVFTPEEMVKLLGARIRMEHKRKIKTLMPFLLIGGFGGVRHEEMVAPGSPVLDWLQVDFEKNEIKILPEVARKIGRDRILPMQPNLTAWLKRYSKPNGPVCDIGNANNALQETAAAAGIKWKDNGLRKSFISYRLAVLKNIGEVADEAGTSPERIRQNYKKTFPRREGLRWFGIWPESADILQVEFGFAQASA